MMCCDGYRMFSGRATVTPIHGEPKRIEGTWLYKPEYKCWYVETRNWGEWCHSFPADIVSDIQEDE